MNELAIILSADNGMYFYEQIYEYIVEEIKKGKLLEGEKLPSTRSLAEYLQVARSTVERSYEQLVSEGYLEVRAYKGYFVSRLEELYNLPKEKKQTIVKEEQKTTFYRYDFSPNAIEADAFPFSVWKTIQKNALWNNTGGLFELGDAKGEKGLRNAITHYLHTSRGVSCEPEQIIVGAGNDYLLLLLEKILGRNRKVAMENPTYQRAFRILEHAGYPIDFIPMDEHGMNIQKLKESSADVAYVMPSHQFPLGIVMPIRRRTELLSWANEVEGRYIIEDDYDSEFRYKGKPIPALQASDKNGKVVYIGTFSKSIAPAIRISYMVLPPKLLEAYQEQAFFYSSTVSRIEQAALEEFITGGYFERHLNKMRKRYKVKHDLLLGLCKQWSHVFHISGDNAGLHLLLTYQGMRSERELLELAKQAGIKVYPVSAYFMIPPKEEQYPYPIFILGFAGLDETELTEGIHLLKEVWSS